jgi:hypothetical protein
VSRGFASPPITKLTKGWACVRPGYKQTTRALKSNNHFKILFAA